MCQLDQLSGDERVQKYETVVLEYIENRYSSDASETPRKFMVCRGRRWKKEGSTVGSDGQREELCGADPGGVGGWGE